MPEWISEGARRARGDMNTPNSYKGKSNILPTKKFGANIKRKRLCCRLRDSSVFFIENLRMTLVRRYAKQKGDPQCGRSKRPILLLLPHHTALVILVCVLRQRPLLFAPFFRHRRRSQTSPYEFVRSRTM